MFILLEPVSLGLGFIILNFITVFYFHILLQNYIWINMDILRNIRYFEMGVEEGIGD